MRLPIAVATILLGTTAALPAFAASPAPLGASLRDAALSPIETIQYQQTKRNRQTTQNRQMRQRGQARGYRGYNAYGADPRAPRAYGGDPWGNYYGDPWRRCVRVGEHTPGRGAYPDWDIC
jgi:hypothetical protein